MKTQSVLLPTKQINEHILDDADLAGPLVFCFIFGMCLLLVSDPCFVYPLFHLSILIARLCAR